ncbi:MAG: DUF4302 domain-containing protein [Paludibacter sp.]
MNSKYRNIVAVILMSSIIIACNRVEDDLFNESAAIRVNKSIEMTNDLLTSVDNGWVFEYFPNSTSVGVTYLVKFPTSSQVTMATVNQYVTTYKEANSYWRVINDMGPVLTFDTYNDVFHLYSAPTLPSTGESDGKGLEGDYEFLIVDKSADIITLKGKKRGTISILRKLSSTQSWIGYFDLINNMNVVIFGKTNARLRLVADNNELYTLKNGSSHIFSLVPNGGDEIDDATDSPFIVTDYGIRMSSPISIGEKWAQNFKLSDDKNELICTDNGVNAKIVSMPSTDIFTDIINARKYMIFKYADENMSETIKSAYTTINNIVVSKTRKLEYIGFTYNKDYGISLSVYSTKGTSKIEGFLNFSTTKLNDTNVRLKFNGFVGKFDTNGKTYYDTYALSGLVALLEDDFTISIRDNALSASVLRFTSITDTTKWFDLILKN